MRHRGWTAIVLDHGHFQCPGQPRDVARLGYSPVSKVSPGGLNAAGLHLEHLWKARATGAGPWD
jgi:hypothetical protein